MDPAGPSMVGPCAALGDDGRPSAAAAEGGPSQGTGAVGGPRPTASVVDEPPLAEMGGPTSAGAGASLDL